MKIFFGPKYTNEFTFIYIDNDFNAEQVTASEISKLELKIANDSCFYFLKYGFVPPPLTIYSNLVCLPVGLDLKVDTKNKSLVFEDNFRFISERSSQESPPKISILRENLIKSLENTLSKNSENILMQSGGKDSTALVDGLKKFNNSYKIKCITYEANFRDKESAIAESICNHYGIDHTIIKPDYNLEYSLLRKYFSSNNSILSADLTLPAYLNSLSKYKDANIIDGLGNDMYMGYIGTRIEKFLKLFNLSCFQQYEPSKITNNEILNYAISSIFMTSEERMFPGTKLSVKEIKKITPLNPKNLFKKFISNAATGIDIDDRKASIRARFCDLALFQTKGLQASILNNNTINFPFGEEEIFEYYFGLPRDFRYSKRNRLNKVLLREHLQTLDVDKSFIKKKSGFRYDIEAFISENKKEIRDVILNCKFFNEKINDFLKIHLEKLNYTSASKIYIVLSFALWHASNSLKPSNDKHLASCFFDSKT